MSYSFFFMEEGKELLSTMNNLVIKRKAEKQWTFAFFCTIIKVKILGRDKNENEFTSNVTKRAYFSPLCRIKIRI